MPTTYKICRPMRREDGKWWLATRWTVQDDLVVISALAALVSVLNWGAYVVIEETPTEIVIHDGYWRNGEEMSVDELQKIADYCNAW